MSYYLHLSFFCCNWANYLLTKQLLAVTFIWCKLRGVYMPRDVRIAMPRNTGLYV